ncbi:MAG: ABC transporter permease [Dehalococcoidia bacterium]|nr:ABC transporter permease [Dehalococcoidia bacterium]
MKSFVIRRLIFSVLTMLGASIIVFSLSRLAGDPMELFAQQGGYGMSDEAHDALEQMLGLDKPFPVQYVMWVGRVLKGDLGRGLVSQEDVSKIIRDKIANTLQLGGVSWVVATLIGIPLGVLSAVKRGTVWDYAGRTLAVFGQGAPPFWIGIMAILIFAVRFDLLPAGGKAGWQSFVMPAATLGLAASAGYLRLMRSSMLEVLDSEFVKLARAKGAGSATVIWKHAFKNAMIAPLTLSALIFAGFISGTVVVETVFVWPGLGTMSVNAVGNNDFPVMTAAVLMFALFYTVINFFADLSYALVDPRIRYT